MSGFEDLVVIDITSTLAEGGSNGGEVIQVAWCVFNLSTKEMSEQTKACRHKVCEPPRPVTADHGRCLSGHQMVRSRQKLPSAQEYRTLTWHPSPAST